MIKRLLLIFLVTGLVAVLGLNGDTSYSAGDPAKQPLYIALGDSLAAGVGASDPLTTGYVPRFHDHVKDFVGDNGVSLMNLGHGGDTSTTLISHGHLAAAVAELGTRNGDTNPKNDVKAVTLDIGGNDVTPLIGLCAGGVTPTCTAAISSIFGTFSGNFYATLGALRAAAGPDTPIIVMTYYNSLVNPLCPFSALAPLGNVVLEGEPLIGLPAGLNDIIRFIAPLHGAKVADLVPGGVFPALLGPSDIQPDCLHANDSGYKIIANEFKEALKTQ